MGNLKLKNFSRVVEDCDRALALNPKYVKAFHRRGKAQWELKNYQAAVEDFQALLRLDPENSEVLRELAELRKVSGIKEGEKFTKIAIEEEDEEEDEKQNNEEL